jgi:hypothetical protein
MLLFVPRFIGLWFVAGALVAITIDAAKSIAASALTLTPFGATLHALAPATLLAAQTFIQQSIEPHLGGWIWNPLIQSVLLLPTWLILGAAGFVLSYVGRRRTPQSAFA